MCKILLGDGADSSMSKKIKQKTKNIAEHERKRAAKKKKHFILGTVYITQHKEAEIGPLIPFWCESTFAAEKLLSFSGFNQKTNKQTKNTIFTPPKTKRASGRKQGRKETCFYPLATTAGKSVKCLNVELKIKKTSRWQTDTSTRRHLVGGSFLNWKIKHSHPAS